MTRDDIRPGLAQMNDDQQQAHFRALAHQYADRYARLVVDALGGTVPADAAAVLHRMGYELGHDACEVLAREIRSRTTLASPEALEWSAQQSGEPAAPILLSDDVDELRGALRTCSAAAHGDSNDAEIEALQGALDHALRRWPELAGYKPESD